MTWLVAGSAALVVGGAPGAIVVLGMGAALRLRGRVRRRRLPVRPLLIVLLIELRSGRSVLGALQTVASAFPERRELARAARIATISGLDEAVLRTGGEIHGVLAQLARSQRSGAALSGTVRSMIEADIAAEKARRVARSRALPVKLMLPITLLLLPGMVLLLYAPSMLRLFDELSGTFS